MEYLLALDQGSTHSKAALVDRRGRLVRSMSAPLRTLRPKPLWVEHRPGEILKSQIGVAEALLKTVGRRRAAIVAVGLAAQRSTLLVWDKGTGRPIAQALSWQDLRGAGEVEGFSEYNDLIRTKTGLLLSPYYAVLKLRWILRHIRGARGKAEGGKLLCGTVNTYLLWHLTRGEVHATDPTHAARMLLMNLRTLNWDPELLDLFEIPRSILPRIQPTVCDFGSVRLGGQKLPVRSSIGDQQAALIGLGAVRPGEAVVNYGTGGFLLVNAGPQPLLVPGLLTSLGWSTPREAAYVLEGTVNAVGTVFEWLRQMGLISSVQEISRVMRPIKEKNRQAYLVPALAGLGAPHWVNDAQMGILGLGPWTTKADLVRAAVEGVAFLIKDIYEVIRRDGSLRIQRLRASGGGSRIDGLIQTQADWLGFPIFRSDVTEATLLGAALLAGVGCGWWESPSGVPKIQTGRVFRPRLSKAERERLYRGWKNALESVKVFSGE